MYLCPNPVLALLSLTFPLQSLPTALHPLVPRLLQFLASDYADQLAFLLANNATNPTFPASPADSWASFSLAGKATRNNRALYPLVRCVAGATMLEDCWSVAGAVYGTPCFMFLCTQRYQE